MLKLLTNANIYAPSPLGLGCILTGGGKILYIGESAPEIDPSDHLRLANMKNSDQV